MSSERNPQTDEAPETTLNSEGTLFLIDDDEDLRFTIGLSLKEAGFEVHEFASADEALAAITTIVPHGVFLDYRIVGMSAPDFVHELRKRGHERIPVVLLTGSHNIADIAAQLRVFDALSKPFDIDDLIKRAKSATAAGRRTSR